jgi:hypothetical protein
MEVSGVSVQVSGQMEVSGVSVQVSGRRNIKAERYWSEAEIPCEEKRQRGNTETSIFVISSEARNL